MAKVHIVVLGAGIIGLSTAKALLETIKRPLSIAIIAEKFGTETTSGNAPGLWTPHLAQPKEKIGIWSAQTRSRLIELSKQGYPVTLAPVTVLHTNTPMDQVKDVDLLKSITEVDVNSSGLRSEIKYQAPVIQTGHFLEKLSSALQQEGCAFIKRKIATIPEFLSTYSPKPDLIVNCLGLGALQVLEDEKCFPIRGVLVRCKPRTSSVPVQAFMHADNPRGITYVVSRPDLCVIGGSGEVGDSNTLSTKEETELVLSRAVEALPALSREGDLRNFVISTWVGLRPGRPEVRLELDYSFGIPVIQNYGHGGSGWTISWGCALEATALVEKILRQSKL